MAMFEYNGEHQNEKLQHWIMIHQPSDNMVYKKAWWDYLIFIRDKIISDMFYWPMVCDMKIDFQEQLRLMSNQYDIVGSHFSKSIEHPVIMMGYKDTTIVFRYNFYDYEITVMSEHDIELPENLFEEGAKTFYYQGFPDQFKIGVPYSQSKRNFTVRINHPCSYNFYTFMFLLKNDIDKKCKGVM